MKVVFNSTTFLHSFSPVHSIPPPGPETHSNRSNIRNVPPSVPGVRNNNSSSHNRSSVTNRRHGQSNRNVDQILSYAEDRSLNSEHRTHPQNSDRLRPQRMANDTSDRKYFKY